jgi:hypothetical protein
VEPGFALGLTLGVGAKTSGGSLRYYGLAQVNSTTFSAERDFNGKLRIVDRQLTDYSLGVRLLLPIEGNLRLFADLCLGLAQVDSVGQSPELPGNIVIRDTTSGVALFAAVGAQYRLFRHLSVGAKLDLGGLTRSDEVDAVTAVTSDDNPRHGFGRINGYLTVTSHF